MKAKWLLCASLFLSLVPTLSTIAIAYDEMQFEIFSPCSGNAAFCMPRIMARGHITDDTPTRFENFLIKEIGHREKYDTLAVCFDSPGGSVRGGMELGYIIRSLQISTCISDSYWSVRHLPEEDRWVEGPWIEDAVCSSACALAFLGGYGREAIGDLGVLGVHQFRSDIGTESTAQIGMTVIGMYFDQMGISRRLLDIASLTPPNEMTWLTKDDLIALGVISSSDSIYNADWSLIHTPSGGIAVMIYQQESWDREIIVRISLLVYIFNGINGPSLRFSIFPAESSPNIYDRLRYAYIDSDGPALRLEINDTRYEYRNVDWILEQDGSISALIVLPSIFSTSPENIHSMHLYAELPNALSDVRLDSYLAPSEYATYIRAALK
ncbi:hypothetical protein QLQ85_15855 [Halomonas sp. M4R5S39]|uniref:COG3904 family protein n=1 Tax=Halomonas kalidii TaxID=3043293 RepID=UPI0024A96032|nr:hypothetical protein [Halomonas kalidii]MDI5986268.1 hypothetical protein [Halomonas kalidii]